MPITKKKKKRESRRVIRKIVSGSESDSEHEATQSEASEIPSYWEEEMCAQ